MTGGRKRRDLLQCVFMPPTNDGDNTKQCRRPSYAAHALPHFPSGWSWLLGEECTERGEGKKGGKKDKPPHGTFFLALPLPPLPPCLLSLFFFSCLDRFRAGWNCDYEGRVAWVSPFIPLSRRFGVIANGGEDHVALKGILVVSVFSLFA